MSNSGSIRSRKLRSILMAATILGGAAAAFGAVAQDAPAPKGEDVVVVTGFRASLANATRAKKNSTNFTESVFATDLGKFPDLNLAESLQRVPGIIVSRDPIAGSGVQVSVRALGPSFSNVLLNGNRFSVASDGNIAGGSQTRETDLDLFATELFTRIDINKTPSANTYEGGIAGTINLQNARPFDHKGQYVTVSAQSAYNQLSEEFSPRITALASKTWNRFGILGGVAYENQKFRSDGFETVGWTDPSLNQFCGTCDPGGATPGVPGGSNGYNILGLVSGVTQPVPANAGNGLIAGSTLNEAQLLALNPGLTEAQLKASLIPRLGRNLYVSGNSKKISGVFSFEYRPSDTLRFAVDIMGGSRHRVLERDSMNWFVRAAGQTEGTVPGGMIPLNMKVDANNVVTSATFANAYQFLDGVAYDEHLGFGNITPSMVWNINETLKLDAAVSYSRSTFQRDLTGFDFLTPKTGGLTINYTNDGSDIPTIKNSLNLNDPNIGWRLYRMVLQNTRRQTFTKSGHVDLTQDFGIAKVTAGVAYDDTGRNIESFDMGTVYQTAFTAAIPDANIGQYLKPMGVSNFMTGISGVGYSQFVLPDYDRIKAATGWASINARRDVALSNANAIASGNINEKVKSAYLMLDGHHDVFGMELRVNGGIRFVSTDQIVIAPIRVNNVIVEAKTETTYRNTLPSFNAVLKVSDKINLRAAASKTMTRANPQQLLPVTTFSDPSAQTASSGNPDLRAYTSDNIDFGGEYYTGGLGYIGLTLFQKRMVNFTTSQQVRRPFDSLGIPLTSLTQQQQDIINNAPGGAGAYTVLVTSQVNVPTVFQLRGTEVMWVQPLDRLVKGLGYSVNYTSFTTNNPTLGTNIPDKTYNVTSFYESGPFSTHISYVYTGQAVGANAPSNNTAYPTINEERHQVDFSASYALDIFGHKTKVTLDGINVTKQIYRQYLGNPNVPVNVNNPGATYILGLQTKF